jgi:SAM-dependent methyltransferase
MKNGTKWLAYGKLAWTDPIIAPPEDYTEETERYCEAIKEHSEIAARTLLHIGCGAGGNDYTFKKHYEVTGVDISEGMLEIARRLNPEVDYYCGDMRTIELGKYFDAVAIPDSIGYMTTEEDLRSAIMVVQKHLKPGGVLLIVASIAERFRQNNFIYTGSGEGIDISLFESNYILHPAGTTYEVTLVYVIRHKGKRKIYTDHHVCGIFKLEIWLDLLKEAGFHNVKQVNIDNSYDRFIVGESEYPLLMFVCRKGF